MKYTFIITIITCLAIYLYCQNRYLLKIIKKAKETETSKQAFVATVVHDLKTPTNAQINSLNLLKNEALGKLNSEQQEIVNLTQESCKYMSNLIGTIMETYKNDYCNIQLEMSEFDVVKLINTLCEETKILSQNKRQTVNFYPQAASINIFADKLQIKRVIQNLISNAITYGFCDTTIEIFAISNNSNSFEFYVKNVSNPIPPIELSTIFDKYKRTKYACKNKISTGLGLYLSKQIIESHKGKVYARSTNDGTCTFGFIIPAKTKSIEKECRLNT
jgi:signal transduction histidine kinase